MCRQRLCELLSNLFLATLTLRPKYLGYVTTYHYNKKPPQDLPVAVSSWFLALLKWLDHMIILMSCDDNDIVFDISLPFIEH